MKVDRDWRIEFETEQIEKIEGASLKRILSSASGREDWAAAIEAARELADPRVVWDAHPVKEIGHGSVLLEGGALFKSLPLAEVVAGATEFLLGVCTIGEALSERVKELQGERRMLRALLLDDLGSWAVDSVRQQYCVRMEAMASREGLYISTCLSPGESSWGLEDQRLIFSLVDASLIGVSLGPTLIMSPAKSLSFVMGRASGPLGWVGGSNCDYCTMKDRCVHRSRRASVTQVEA